MNLGGTIRLNPIGVCILIGIFLFITFYALSGSSGDSSDNNPQDDKNLVSLKSLLITAIEVADKGGRIVKSTRNEADLIIKSKGKTLEGENDPVTNADFRSHCIMFHTIQNKFPKVKVISEEHPQNKCQDADKMTSDVVGVLGVNHLSAEMVPSEDVTVWIDPLDATKEFTEKLVQYVTTMVCVAVKGVPVIGVINAPFDNHKTIWGWVNKATSNGLNKDDVLAHQSSLEGTVVAVSRSHAGKVKNISQAAFGPDTKITPAAGSGYKVLEVLNGHANVYLHVTAIKKWDVCAGDALMRSVGGYMVDLKGNTLDYSSNANPINDKGLLVTMNDPKEYVQKLSKV